MGGPSHTLTQIPQAIVLLTAYAMLASLNGVRVKSEEGGTDKHKQKRWATGNPE